MMGCAVPGVHDYSHMNVNDIGDIFGDMFGDIFGDIFGGRRGRRSAGGGQRPSRGYDLETTVQLTLEEVSKGCEKTIEFTRGRIHVRNAAAAA